MQSKLFHVTYRDRSGAIQTARTSGTGSSASRMRADAIRNVKARHPGSREHSAVGIRSVRMGAPSVEYGRAGDPYGE